MHRFVKLTMSALCAFAVCGCAGSGGTAAQTTLCSNVIAPTPLLVSPAPGETGVSTSIGSIILSRAVSTETATLTPAGGSPIALGNVVPGSTQESVTVPTLASGTSYSVAISNIGGACGASVTQTIGSFVTR